MESNYYYDSNNRNSRRGGLIATGVYVLFLTLIFWLVNFSIEVEQVEHGIMIDFGDSEFGRGSEDMEATDTPAPSAAKSGVATPEQILTDDNSQVEMATTEVVESIESTSQQQTLTEQTQVEEQPREVNKRALFPGRTLSSESSSQGESDVAQGNQGDVSGERESTLGATGAGVEGVSWNLSGRSVVGRLPLPSYSENATGRVVIEIMVDDKGNVTRATYNAQGSTTNNSQLVAAARAAALSAKFSPSDDFAQVGTITYTFRLN
ncbi:MAG: TonB family protein [Rikenellaceae bacterium]